MHATQKCIWNEQCGQNCNENCPDYTPYDNSDIDMFYFDILKENIEEYRSFEREYSDGEYGDEQRTKT